MKYSIYIDKEENKEKAIKELAIMGSYALETKNIIVLSKEEKQAFLLMKLIVDENVKHSYDLIPNPVYIELDKLKEDIWFNLFNNSKKCISCMTAEQWEENFNLRQKDFINTLFVVDDKSIINEKNFNSKQLDCLYILYNIKKENK